MLSWNVATLLIASIVVVSASAWVSKAILSALILSPILVVKRLQLYRLLTAGWIHADPTHLIFNLLTLHSFAGAVVLVLGEVKFAILYISAVVVAFLPTTVRHMNNSRYTSLGASGAVAAVMFSAILLRPNLRLSLFFLPIPVPGFVYACLYLA